MARDFTKNTSNLLQIAAQTIGNVLNGASKVSVHSWVELDSVSTGTVQENYICAITIATGSDGISWGIDGTGGTRRLFLRGRSASGDSGQIKTATTSLSLSTYHSLGGVFDFAGDTITPYVNGTAEGGGAVTFANAAYTQSTTSTAETIGSEASGGHTTAKQTDGRIAEVAFWDTDIGSSGFASLAAGVSASLVSPSNLKVYFKILGTASPELDEKLGISATITGSLPQATHPAINYGSIIPLVMHLNRMRRSG